MASETHYEDLTGSLEGTLGPQTPCLNTLTLYSPKKQKQNSIPKAQNRPKSLTYYGLLAQKPLYESLEPEGKSS